MLNRVIVLDHVWDHADLDVLVDLLALLVADHVGVREPGEGRDLAEDLGLKAIGLSVISQTSHILLQLCITKNHRHDFLHYLGAFSR